MTSRLGEPRKRTGAARFAGPVAPTPVIADPAEEEEDAQEKLTASRLGGDVSVPSEPEPVIAMSAAVAEPVAEPSPTVPSPAIRQEEMPPSRLIVKTAKPEKRAVAIRLTADALRRLMEIETSLRGSGFSAHQASASEIVMTLLEAADLGDLRERLSRRFHKGRTPQ